MFAQAEFHRVSPKLSVWHRYDPAVKTDLYTTRLETLSEMYLIDPISIESSLPEVPAMDLGLTGLIVTNANHARAAVELSARLRIPIYAHAAATVDLAGSEVRQLSDGFKIASELTAFTINGAAPGEIALHCTGDGGTLVFGDALINLGANGLTFLPPKYCANPKLLRLSLRKFLNCEFERMLFAHGTPIVFQAYQRFADLLGGER
ncbi:MAG TPA: hypothetical protein VK474_09300 [Chthoniobacterales bacterium]|nr:hypothetical protein [Chthoniobacterales bacterium]